jgi:DNA-binding PadR family transcriptional regulator
MASAIAGIASSERSFRYAASNRSPRSARATLWRTRHPHEHHGGGGPGFGRRGRRGGRAGRGDVRAAVLLLLAEEPMHGYQLMQAISDRSGGRWTPSPGAIYPTINQLEDEGLVTISAEGGRKLAVLTDAGREQADALQAEENDPFETFGGPSPHFELRNLMGELAGAVREVARSGDDTQLAAAADILKSARRSLYLLLADRGES